MFAIDPPIVPLFLTCGSPIPSANVASDGIISIDNVKKAIKMLQKATNLKKNDGYIIDSLGWAYFVNKNYIDAEKFLQKAVELMPQDPVINDHYADALWMLDKSIQARYVWKYVLGLESAEQKLKENINQKLIFGIKEKL